MKVVIPEVIDASTLYSSSVAEDEYPTYSSLSTYALAAKVIKSNHIWESLQANNSGNDPETTTGWWLDTGATNRYNMFDKKVGTSTTALGFIEVEIIPTTVVQALALLELSNASRVIITSTHPVLGVVYSKTVDLLKDLTTSSWWSFFFEPIARDTFVLLEDLPTYKSSTIKVRVEGDDTATVGCGVCILGKIVAFTQGVEYGMQLGIENYSDISRDVFGVTSITKRGYAKKASWQFKVRSNVVDHFQETMSELKDVPALYIGTSLLSSAMIYGIFSEFYTTVARPRYSDCNVDILGMI